VISVEAVRGAGFGPALAAVAAAGLAVKDVETIRTRLEDVFVRLVGRRREEGTA
jgi:ABC-2 type transport system ATP-binding protein